MSALRMAGILLLPLCGWLMGDAVQTRCRTHLAALLHIIGLLQRIRQEILYRRVNLQELYHQLCREGLLPEEADVSSLQQLRAPEVLPKPEQACFQECFSGLGRTGSAQECERLAYYQARFTGYLEQAQRTAQTQTGLPHRLGLAGGLMLALLFF